MAAGAYIDRHRTEVSYSQQEADPEFNEELILEQNTMTRVGDARAIGLPGSSNALANLEVGFEIETPNGETALPETAETNPEIIDEHDVRIQIETNDETASPDDAETNDMIIDENASQSSAINSQGSEVVLNHQATSGTIAHEQATESLLVDGGHTQGNRDAFVNRSTGGVNSQFRRQ